MVVLSLILGVLGVAAGGGWGLVVAGVPVVALLIARAKWAAKIEAEARSMMVPNSCASPDTAVEYVEWYSTSHTFVFSSQPYLNAFLLANHQKT